ncbi:MAG: T9SS type A sorting domain-containing protein, partial [Flavobacteriaceae bacterium]|nr:T9SS type A sorting domain-containing protein [Flavobacteriaceae bacterium]
WSTGETTQSITVSPTLDTTYTVNVYQNGCEASDTVTVYANNTVIADAGEDVTICEGASVVLTASGGDSYLWSTGETNQSISVNPTSTESYTVSAIIGDDFDTDSVTVNVNELPQVNAGEDVTVCGGIAVTLIASGGNNFLWSTGETTQNITVYPTETTTYTVTVDNNGCEASDDVIVTVVDTPIANAGPNQNIPSGQSATLTATGGGTYLWSTGETSATIIVSPAQTTHYTVTVSNGSCEDSDIVNVAVNGQPSAYAGEDVTICEGESTVLVAEGGNSQLWSTGETTEEITVSPTVTTTYILTSYQGSHESTDDVTVFVTPTPDPDLGEDLNICSGESLTLTSQPGDFYIWSTGEITQSITINPVATTIYTVLIGQNGCEGNDEITVNVTPIPNVELGEDVTICEGEIRVLTATGGETYLWSTGETTPSISVSPSSTTTYTVTAYENGCESTDDVIVNVNQYQEVNAGEDVTMCGGDTVTLTATGGQDYLWSTGETTSSITVSPTQTTAYFVTLNADECPSTDEVIVTVNSFPQADAGNDVTICEGQSMILSASGIGEYLWDTGETSQSIIVSPAITTTYTLTVNNDGCEDTDTVTVFVNPTPEADAGEEQTIILGESATLTASGGDSYLWSTGETTQSITVTPETTTSYSVTVTSNGCDDIDAVLVVVNEQAVAEASENVTICEGESTILSASGGNTYEWSTGETTQEITVSPTSTTTYIVTVYLGNSSSSDEVTVTVDPLPNANAGEDVTICAGESIQLTASGGSSFEWNTGETTQSITVSPSGTTSYSVIVEQNGCLSSDQVTVNINELPQIDLGNDTSVCYGEPYTLTAPESDSYLWSTGETTQNITVSPTSVTSYSVTISQNGCDASDEIIISVDDLPSVNASSDVSICYGESATLSATGDGESYLWSTGETTSSITVSPDDTTIYTVTTFQNGCEAIDDVSVIVTPFPDANAGEDISICEGENVTIMASGNGNFLWSTGQITPMITVSPAETTTYQLTVNLNGCESIDEVTVFVSPTPAADAGPDINIQAGESAVLTATGGDTYLWSTGETTSSITVSPSDTTSYTVTVDSNGCEATDEVVVIVDDQVMANAGEDVTVCEGQSIILTASGGTSYLWSDGQTEASIIVSPAVTTTYSVTVTTGDNSDTDEVTVFVNESPNADAGSDITICQGEIVSLTASGGGTYFWSTGQTDQNIEVSPQSTTIYEVIVTLNGCQSSDQVTVTVNQNPDVSAGDDVTIIQGDSTTLTASAGDSYLWSTGETTQSISVSPNDTTVYSVIVNSGGCEGIDEVMVIVNDTLNAYAGEDVTICEGEAVVLTASGGTEFLWSTGETTASITVSPETATNYSVQVTVGSSTDTDEVTVYVNDGPDVQVSGDETILMGEYVTLSASGADSYLWSNGATDPNIAVNPSTTTTYSVTGFINDCAETKDITVNVLEPVEASAGQDQSICAGSSITLTASGGENYEWSTGETTQSITVSPEEDTVYTVMVSNELDSGSDEVMVLVEACEDPIGEELPIDLPPFQYDIYSASPNSPLFYAKIIGLSGPASLIIQDIQGKLIYWKDIDNNNGQRQDIPIYTNQYSQGIYTITLREQDKSTTKKVLFR